MRGWYDIRAKKKREATLTSERVLERMVYEGLATLQDQLSYRPNLAVAFWRYSTGTGGKFRALESLPLKKKL